MNVRIPVSLSYTLGRELLQEHTGLFATLQYDRQYLRNYTIYSHTAFLTVFIIYYPVTCHVTYHIIIVTYST